MARLGVLASGSGSNLQALIDAELGADIAVVIANVPGARALERAEKARIPAVLIDHKMFQERAAFDRAVVGVLQTYRVDWVVLAGFMRLITPVLLDAYKDRIVNIHPALLPSFPGTHSQRRALEAGVKITGCTVHLVDEGTDTGPILAQAAVPVLAGDDEESLRLRILEQEHKLLPAVVRALVEGRLRFDEKKRAFIAAGGEDPAARLVQPRLESRS
jgi:phosphoribosylglycinamide formyltransferase 1